MTLWTLLIFVLVALPSSVCDVIKMRIPLYLVLAGILAYILFYAFYFDFQFNYFLKQVLISLLGTGFVLITARLLTDGGLGWGDVFFGLFCAFFIGYPLFCFIALASSAVLGLLFYLAFSLTKKIKNGGALIIRHSFAVPYIPFMAAGTLVTYFLLWINWLNF